VKAENLSTMIAWHKVLASPDGRLLAERYDGVRVAQAARDRLHWLAPPRADLATALDRSRLGHDEVPRIMPV